jgi:hypothetical protein
MTIAVNYGTSNLAYLLSLRKTACMLYHHALCVFLYFGPWIFLRWMKNPKKCSNPSMYWHSTFSCMFRHFKMPSGPSRRWPCHLLQYTASVRLWFLQHWAPISAGSWLTPWLWHSKVPKRVGECRVSMHWIITAFVGFLFTLLHYVCSVVLLKLFRWSEATCWPVLAWNIISHDMLTFWHRNLAFKF